MLKDDSGTWRSLTALIGHDRLLEWLEIAPDTLANRIADSALPLSLRSVIKSSLLDLLSEQSSLSHPGTAELWKNICTQCDLGIGTLTTLAAGALPGQHARLRRLLAERVTRITVKPFMDISTMIEERLTQCCVHVGTKSDDGAQQCAPFCAVQAWPALGRQRLSTTTGLPLPATGSVRPTRHRVPTVGLPMPADPLSLCIFATVALLGWLAGPAALAVFAAIGFVGYWRARRAGLLRSRCFLRDTRLVIAYLGVLVVAGGWGISAMVARLLGS
jgi:hypothetical protein